MEFVERRLGARQERTCENFGTREGFGVTSKRTHCVLLRLQGGVESYIRTGGKEMGSIADGDRDEEVMYALLHAQRGRSPSNVPR